MDTAHDAQMKIHPLLTKFCVLKTGILTFLYIDIDKT